MIIWINGAFGSGKTQTAYELARRLPGSYVYDPENLGYFIQKNRPPQLKLPDFQDHPAWREFNYVLLSDMANSFDGVIIAPMTLVSPTYFAEIIGRLRSDGATVEHFTLCATKEVIRQRLRRRGEKKNSWPEQQIERCVAALSDPTFARHLDTNQLSIEAVVEAIGAALNLPLEPDTRGPLRRRFDRTITQLRHLRF